MDHTIARLCRYTDPHVQSEEGVWALAGVEEHPWNFNCASRYA